MSSAIQIENLCKKYKDNSFSLKNINLTVPRGSIMGFVGKNGAGKSTTINTLLNLLHKDSGTVKIFDKEMTDDETYLRNEIGVVFDSINFSGNLTVRKLEKVLSDIYSNWEKQVFYAYIDRFKLPANKKLKTFSRGMSMKLSLCVALSHGAKLLILDEATAGLDPVVREEILDVFLEFVEDENNSILISSHISSDLEKIADYITFIDSGEIIITEKKDTLIYEYGIARMKQADFDKLQKADYISYRQRGLQLEVLVKSKKEFLESYPNVVVDNSSIDEILPLLTQEVC